MAPAPGFPGWALLPRLVLLLLSNVGAVAVVGRSHLGEQRITTKIIKLLEKMAADLDQDQDADDHQNEKFECWCKVNALEKTDAVKALEQEIENLEAQKTEALARVERLQVRVIWRFPLGI